MNFYWNEGSLQNRGLTLDTDGFPSHLLVSEILNLGAAIYLHQQDARLNEIMEPSMMEKDHQIRLSAMKLLEGVANVGLQILRALRTSTSIPVSICVFALVRGLMKSSTEFCEISIEFTIN